MTTKNHHYLSDPELTFSIVSMQAWGVRPGSKLTVFMQSSIQPAAVPELTFNLSTAAMDTELLGLNVRLYANGVFKGALCLQNKSVWGSGL